MSERYTGEQLYLERLARMGNEAVTRMVPYAELGDMEMRIYEEEAEIMNRLPTTDEEGEI